MVSSCDELMKKNLSSCLLNLCVVVVMSVVEFATVLLSLHVIDLTCTISQMSLVVKTKNQVKIDPIYMCAKKMRKTTLRLGIQLKQQQQMEQVESLNPVYLNAMGLLDLLQQPKVLDARME